jgi:endonuclease YncB( thermonuclease family)
MSFSAKAVCAASIAAALAAAAHGGNFTAGARVTHVVDGDTIDVRLASGRLERVRVLGIDTPELGTCWASQAAAATTRLAQGRQVTLVGDATQATRDRYGRLLAYVWLPHGKDLGFQLIAGGFARSYVYERPFRRLKAYERAEALAAGKGVWRCDKRPGRCHPSYKGACLSTNVSDYDCAGAPGRDPKVPHRVRVVGPDVFRLDADGDGYGCDDS